MKKFTSLVLALCIATPTPILANTQEPNQSSQTGPTVAREIVNLAAAWYLSSFAVGVWVGVARMSDPPHQRAMRAVSRGLRAVAPERVGAKEVALFGYFAGLWVVSSLKRLNRELR